MSTHTIKGLRAEFKSQGKFHTPPELAKFLRGLIPGTPSRVYDPTCGAGSLLAEFPDEVEKFGQDVDGAAVGDAATSLTNFHGHVGDVLTDPAWVDERFPAIVANPPFSIRWEPQSDERFMSTPTVPTASRADFAFLIHILHMLADDGTAVVLNFPGIGYRGGREGMLRQWFVQQNYVDQVIAIPGNTFTDTAISTLCIILRKDRVGETIRFEDREHELTRDVAISEVADNDFSLSVSRYVVPEIGPSEVIDPVELEMAARRGLVRKLRAELVMSRFAAEAEGLDFQEFAKELRAVIDDSVLDDGLLGATK